MFYMRKLICKIFISLILFPLRLLLSTFFFVSGSQISVFFYFFDHYQIAININPFYEILHLFVSYFSFISPSEASNQPLLTFGIRSPNYRFLVSRSPNTANIGNQLFIHKKSLKDLKEQKRQM